jgi:hypothetical protein
MENISEKFVKPVRGRGRNGSFEVESVEVFHMTMEDLVYVDIYSRRIGRAAPISLHGTHKDMMKLADLIAGKIRMGR